MSSNKEQEIKSFLQLAEQGDIDAQKSLADFYFDGDEVEKDYVQAVKWLEILVTDKEWDWWDIQIGWKLVNCYSEGGYGLEPNYSKAEKWSKKIVETNNRGRYWDRLRDFYFKGTKEFEPNPIKGFEWLKKWAEQSYARAQNELAECYFEGIGVEKNTDNAIEWLEKSAEQGYAKAQNRLAECYFQGIGVEKNTDKAIEWLKKAAFEDFTSLDNLSDIGRDRVYRDWKIVTEARRQLAFRYFFGKEVNQDYVEALNWFTKYERSSHDQSKKLELEIFTYFAGNKKESIEFFESCKNSYGKLWKVYFYYLINKSDIEKMNNKDVWDPYSYSRLKNIRDYFYKYLEGVAESILLDELYISGEVRNEGFILEKCVISDDNIDIIFHKIIIDFLEAIKNCDSKIILAFYYQYKKDESKYIELLSDSGSLIAKYKLGQYYKKLGSKEKAKEYFKEIQHCYEDIVFFAWLSDIEKKVAELAKQEITELEHEKELEIKNKELEEKNQQLELEIKKKEALQNRMQKLVEQFTHSLGNVIFPDTIYQVAERLKNLPECRRDTLLLHEAYHAEIIIKLQAELLRHRYGNKEPESFRNMIRKCRRNSNSSDKIKSIEDILNYAVSRATARFLNQHYAGLETIRNKILSQTNTELNQLKQKFEDDILLHNCLSPIEWVSQNLRPVQITQFSPLWKKIYILADSYAEALLFGYFSEILFNALKYADHDNKEFLTLSFTETNINDNFYLLSNWSNPTTKQKLPELGTNKGLEAIAEDLKQLNGTEKPEESLLISQQANQFQVSLFFKKELLVKTTKATVPETLWG